MPLRDRSRGVVIVGGGLAGQRCAEALRRRGYEGTIRIVCAEPHRPYDRPPLSKDVLAGTCLPESLSYRPPDWYDDCSVDLLMGTRATGLSPAEHRLSLTGGATLSYESLLIASGSRPRSLPVLAPLDNVSTLRTVEDARRLRDVLRRQPRLAVIGAGFIGQEVAATARRSGADVTMIEAASCPLEGILGPELGGWFARFHRSEGVELICGCTVTRAEGNRGVIRLHLSDDHVVEADHVVVGVGVEADIGWLSGSGVHTNGGVTVDQQGRTMIEGVYAAGDAAATYDAALDRHVPGSHWEAAGRQGARVAKTMLGVDPGDVPLTSFWTDQYGVRIQYLGHARLSDRVELDGDTETRSFKAIFYRGEETVAALLVNRPRELAAARTLIGKGTT